ncbi:hypothetical protein BDZ90DRAFT_229777 [Jaminaea rosea]|uniref:Uncharacterized protein n=1 Tax=Jaminaea rosea TaxID=1569628 RepID=A0A316UZP9_9BASI|nr:hypothetical protein BDZ90DRAFT_229777 [Jaminaea rosea]PWN30780.1 hypothetical protein BDZ90DRAFT_229777 [Jaminaea rosea]
MAPLTNLECSAWRDAPQSQDMDHRRQQSYTISKAARSQAEEPTFPLAKDGDAQQQQQHLVTNHFSNLHLSPDIPNRTTVTSSWTAYDSAASRDQASSSCSLPPPPAARPHFADLCVAHVGRLHRAMAEIRGKMDVLRDSDGQKKEKLQKQYGALEKELAWYEEQQTWATSSSEPRKRRRESIDDA